MADPRDLALGLYDAVLQGQPLDKSLGAIADALDAQTGFIARIGLQHGRPVTATDFTSHAVSQETLHDYARDWLPHDPRATAWGWEAEGVVNFGRFCPLPDFLRSTYWNEFGVHREPSVHTLAVTFIEANDLHGTLTVLRPPERPPFGAEEEGFLATLYPHLRQALLARARLGSEQRREAWLEAGLDAMRQGVAVLDAAGRLCHANAALEAMAAQRDGLAIGPDGLLLTDQAAMAQARHALGIAVAVSGGRIRLLPDGMSFAVPRPSGKAPWLVQMLPLRRAEQGSLAGLQGAVAVVTDGATRRPPSALLLQKLLGLTPAEADLAAALAQGRDIAEQARRRRVSRETLRSHLAAIRRKTGCRRQAELVALVLRLGG
jgi:DNA-binding CsgD family transcriptional regulator/PAS domain-containing protein